MKVMITYFYKNEKGDKDGEVGTKIFYKTYYDTSGSESLYKILFQYETTYSEYHKIKLRNWRIQSITKVANDELEVEIKNN